VRSLYRTPRVDGAVEIRYRRDQAGLLISTLRVDRTGGELAR
jgi:hypothetical protein